MSKKDVHFGLTPLVRFRPFWATPSPLAADVLSGWSQASIQSLAADVLSGRSLARIQSSQLVSICQLTSVGGQVGQLSIRFVGGDDAVDISLNPNKKKLSMSDSPIQ